MARISINGAAGRMGRMLLQLLSERKDIEVVEALVEPGSNLTGKDAWAAAGITAKHSPLSIGTKHWAGNVMIDFSLPEGLRSRLPECAERKTALVSGTTGLTDADRAALLKAAEVIPVLHATNFSVGVAVLNRLCRETAQVLAGFDCEIVEAHHRHKRDAPSGTALSLLESVQQGLAAAGSPARKVVNGRHGDVGARPADEIGMHAVRGGDVIGDHTVSFFGEGERVELTHRASSRTAFASGAIVAALALAGKPPGMYTIEDVLFGAG